jgi:GNAT superfamily N-acetyltransferase
VLQPPLLGGLDDFEPGPPVAAEPYAESVRLRDATGDDWSDIYPFFVETVAAGETYAYPEDLSSEQARALWMQPPPWRTIVAVEGDQVLGTAIVGPNRPGRGSHVATASFMVAPAAQGRGVGRALGEHVLDLAREIGYRAMQFNAVVETNRAAVVLWRSLGFNILATVPEAFDHPRQGLVGLHIMHRPLIPPNPT